MQTLQSFCLNRIATSFDRYHYVYSTTKNEDLQGALLFLQRFYSHELVTRLNRGYRLKEKHADFIFNKFLKYMDTDWLTNFSWDGIVNIFERIGPNLENVCFSRRRHPWKDVIPHLPNAKVVKYRHYCNNSILQSIAETCPSLETLDVSGSDEVSDDGFKHFCQRRKGLKRKRTENKQCFDTDAENGVPCPRLKEIILHEAKVGDNVIAQLLKNLPLLERIEDYENLPLVLHVMHKGDSFHTIRKYKLKYLNLIYYLNIVIVGLFRDILKTCVTVCPNVKTLLCPISNSEHLNLCSALLDVEDLQLLCTEDSGVEVNDFLKQKGGKLTCLTLRNCAVSLSVLGQHCQRLQSLHVDRVTFQLNDNDSALVFQNLERFSAREIDLTKSSNCKAISCILRSSAVLEGIWLLYTSLTPDFKTAILKCELATVDYVCYTDTGAAEFSKDDKQIHYSGDKDVEFFKALLLSCRALQTLELVGGDELEDFRRIAERLPSKPRIMRVLPM